MGNILFFLFATNSWLFSDRFLQLWLEPIAQKKLMEKKFEELNLISEVKSLLQVNTELLALMKASKDVGGAIVKMVRLDSPSLRPSRSV